MKEALVFFYRLVFPAMPKTALRVLPVRNVGRVVQENETRYSDTHF